MRFPVAPLTTREAPRILSPMRAITRCTVLVPLLLLAACGGEDEASGDPAEAQQAPPGAPTGSGAGSDTGSGPAPQDPGPAPASVAVEDPSEPVDTLELVEDLTEETADWLLELSDKLRRRDFVAAAGWFDPQFWGHGLGALPEKGASPLALGATANKLDVAEAQIVHTADFLVAQQELIGDWERVDRVLWKVKGAEFQRDARRPWGKLRLKFTYLGVGAGNRKTSVSGWAWARVAKRRGQWWLERFELESMKIYLGGQTPFTEVSASAGVAHTWARFGQPENRSYAWNGAAAGDIDGDGDWDLFLPSDGRNYLYLAQPDGTYSEVAEERGVALPPEGTGAVFVDIDNDRDQDLFVSQVSWKEPTGKLGGRLPGLYLNDGKGHFTAAKGFGGLDTPLVGYHATALDYDLDGWVDVFIACYGRIEAEHNNSWIEATNGAPNVLLRNLEGKGFANVTEQAGLGGTSWSYAAAAADVDRDGNIDLYVANDYGSNRFYRNLGDGRFEEIGGEVGITDQGNGMGCAFGDLTGDGRLDLYVSNMSSTAGSRILGRLADSLNPELLAALRKSAAGNTIFHATDDLSFTKLDREAGGVGGNWAWSTALFDVNLDGALDVFCTNGFVTGNLPHDT